MSPLIDDVALRDVEPWKDRLEVRLDNRQVFFLFFGSAMVACLLFVLGVIVGKKLETRGRAEAPAIEDPLAILDRLGSQGPMPPEQAVTFPKALTSPSTPAPRAHAAAPVREASREAPRAETAPATHAAAPTTAKGLAPVAASSPRAPAAAPKILAPAAAPKVLVPPTASPPVPRAPVTPPPIAARPTTPSPAPAVPAAPAAKGRFTLQLSAYQDKSEAEAMARRLGTGHSSVVATEIPGKGTWYRVRSGSFATFQEAATAKATFEREHNVIAYVASSGAGTSSGAGPSSGPPAKP